MPCGKCGYKRNRLEGRGLIQVTDNMQKTLAEVFLQLTVILPLIILTIKDKEKENLKVIFVFLSFFTFHKLLLNLPIKYEELRIVNGNWNWAGKIYGILGSILFLFVYRKFKREDYFLTLKQGSKFKNNGLKVVFTLFIIGAIINHIFFSPKDWNFETIMFQLTMPGLDEELAYRGIMLGMLTQVLKKDISFFGMKLGTPAIWITSILFGLVHSLFFSSTYEIQFHFISFCNSLIYGLIWAWLTLKSGSILLALISHNLANTTLNLIRMVK